MIKRSIQIGPYRVMFQKIGHFWEGFVPDKFNVTVRRCLITGNWLCRIDRYMYQLHETGEGRTMADAAGNAWSYFSNRNTFDN